MFLGEEDDEPYTLHKKQQTPWKRNMISAVWKFFMYRHHVMNREFFMRDVIRHTQTNLNRRQEHQHRRLLESRQRTTIIWILVWNQKVYSSEETPHEGQNRSGEGLTIILSTSRPDDIWPYEWSNMSSHSQREAIRLGDTENSKLGCSTPIERNLLRWFGLQGH